MLASFAEARVIKPKLSANNQTIWNPLFQEVENYYLPKLLGRGFAYDVQKTPANYTDLLDGVEFTDCNDEIIKFQGIKYILVFFAFAQYVGESPIVDTFTGLVGKNRDDARTATQGQESTLKQTNRKYAESERMIMEEYLNQANLADSDTYPLWKCTTQNKSGTIYAPKFHSIKRTDV